MTISSATKIYNTSLGQIVAAYYRLTKPGIIRGNAITAAAGYFVAARGQHFITGETSLAPLIAMLAGLSLVIASACVCNNYMDRGIDRKMSRTCDRALVTGLISERAALIYASILGVGGAAVLLVATNAVTACLAVFGFVAYVVIYGAAKRASVHGTVVGSLSGAIPPMVGYAAAAGRVDLGAVLLFAILVCWQMPHFYAIATYRAKDYKAAGIPVLPVKSGLAITRRQMIVYIGLFIVTSLSLYVFGYMGLIYAGASLVAGCFWIVQAFRGLRLRSDTQIVRWSHQMFGWSLLVITIWALAIAVDSIIA